MLFMAVPCLPPTLCPPALYTAASVGSVCHGARSWTCTTFSSITRRNLRYFQASGFRVISKTRYQHLRRHWESSAIRQGGWLFNITACKSFGAKRIVISAQSPLLDLSRHSCKSSVKQLPARFQKVHRRSIIGGNFLQHQRLQYKPQNSANFLIRTAGTLIRTAGTLSKSCWKETEGWVSCLQASRPSTDVVRDPKRSDAV
jgi:hypothetical protein